MSDRGVASRSGEAGTQPPLRVRTLDTLGRDRYSVTRLVEDERGRRRIAREFAGASAALRAKLKAVFALQRQIRTGGLVRPVRLVESDGSLVWIQPPAAGTALSQSQFGPGEALHVAAGLVRLLLRLHEMSLFGVELTPERLFVEPDGRPTVAGLLADPDLWSAPGGFAWLKSLDLDSRIDLPRLGEVILEVLRRTRGEGPEAEQVTSQLERLARRLLAPEPAERPGLADTLRQLRDLGAPAGDIPREPEGIPVPALVGRETLLKEIETHLERVLRGGVPSTRCSHLVAVTGRPGVGKSRVLTEVATWARAHGVEVLAAQCRADDRRLLGPLQDVMSGVVLPSLGADGGEAPLLSPTAERRRDIEAAVRALQESLGERQTLILLEDADLLPEPALEALSYLVRDLALEEPDSARLALVLSMRSDEDASAPSAASRAVDELREDGFAERVRLPGFDHATLREMGRSMGVRVAEIEFLAPRAGGNPRMFEELARLRRRDHRRPLPDSIHGAFGRRVRLLGAEERRVLEAAAILGRPASLDLLEALVSADDRPRLWRTVVGLVAQRLLRASPGPSFEFRFRDAAGWLREGIPVRRARRLHRLAGRAIEALPTPADPALLAHHALLGGDRARFLAHGREAASALERSHSNEQALTLYERLLEAVGKGKGKLMERRTLLERCAVLRGLRGDFLGAVEAYQELLRIAPPDLELWQIHKALGEIYRDMEDYVSAAASFDRGLATLGPGEDLAVAVLLSEKAPILARLGDLDTARGLADMAGNLASELGNSREVAAIQNRVGATFHRMGDHDRAVSHIEEGLRMSEQVGALDLAAVALNNLALYLASRGELTRATELCRRSLEIHEKLGDLDMIATTAVNLGAFYLSLCDLESAQRHLDKGLRLGRRFGRSFVVAACLANLAELHFLRGHYQEALETRLKALRMGERLGRREDYAEWLLALCRDQRLLCNLEEAERTVRRLGQLSVERDGPRLQALCLVAEAGLARLRGDIPGARELLLQAEQSLRDIGAAEALVAALLERAELELAAGERQAALVHAGQALGLAAERGYHPDRALALLLTAETMLTEDLGAAERAVREAEGISGELDQPELRWRCEALAGEIALRKGDRKGAARRFALARDILDRIVERMGDPGLRYSYMKDSRRLAVLRRSREIPPE